MGCMEPILRERSAWPIVGTLIGALLGAVCGYYICVCVLDQPPFNIGWNMFWWGVSFAPLGALAGQVVKALLDWREEERQTTLK